MGSRETTKKTKKQLVLDALGSGQPQRFSVIREIAGSFLPIQELLDDGKIVKIAKSFYGLAGRHHDWNSLATMGLRYPESVICMDTAASYHGLTTQNPHEVFAAFLYGKKAIPRVDKMAVRSFRWREDSMTVGVETIEVADGITVKMTSPERTVVDLLRFMSRRGDDEHAMEALNAYASRGGAMRSLIEISGKLKCEKTVRPFATMILGLRNLP